MSRAKLIQFGTNLESESIPMYNPAIFRVTALPQLWDFIERHSFALLVTGAQGELAVSHLPILLERNQGERGQLSGHLARANPQWQNADGTQVLVVFSGPQAYVSPSWYEARNAVPTWNYVAVHVTGRIRFLHEPEMLRSMVERTVDTYESGEPIPWSVEIPEAGYLDKLCEAIVGFTIDIDSIEGKWKLSQNHDRERRERVIQKLTERSGENSQAIARLMRETLGSETAH